MRIVVQYKRIASLVPLFKIISECSQDAYFMFFLYFLQISKVCVRMLRTLKVFLWKSFHNLHLQLNIKPGICPNISADHLECWVHGGELDAVPRKVGIQINRFIFCNTKPKLLIIKMLNISARLSLSFSSSCGEFGFLSSS